MNTKHKFNRMPANILSIVAILAIAFSAAGVALGTTVTSARADAPWWQDDFDGSLGEPWFWVNENSNQWSLTEQPGFLRIYTSPYPTGSENLLLRPPDADKFTLETRLLFEPSVNFQFAGLVIWQDESNALQLGRAFCDVEEACVGNGIYFDYTEGGTWMGNFGTPVDNPSEAYLRLEYAGGIAQGYYSADGTNWMLIGVHEVAEGFTINGIGLTSSQNYYADAIPADFDYFAERSAPWLIAFPENDAVEGWEWPEGATVYLTIDNAPEGFVREGTAEVTSWGDPRTYVLFDFAGEGGYDLQVGDEVTLTDEFGTTTTHTVQYLSVVEANGETDTVTGTSYDGASVQVWPHGYDQDYTIDILVGEDESWQADFGALGFTNIEETGGRSWIVTEGGNATAVDWHVTYPRFTVFPEWEWFDGLDWPDGANVVITVKDKPECTTSKESWGYFFNGSFGEGCDVVVGDEVTFTYGDIVRTHTVRNLAIAKVNQEDDLVKGTADAGAEVHVWPHATGQEQIVIANPKGKWDVDFTGIYDLMPGDGGRSEIRDEMSNATAVDWYVSKPRIVASITEDWFYLQEFSPDKILDFTVYEAQGGKPIWKGTVTTDRSGFAWIDSEGRWNLEPGNYLVVKDGSNTKDLIIEGFTFDVFDVSLGFLQGTAPEPFGRAVSVGIGCWQRDDLTMEVTTNENGAWVADFGAPVPHDFGCVYAQIYDSDGDASELRPDRIVDLWVSAYTYDYGTWVAGDHRYHFEATWTGGSEITDEIYFNVSDEAELYDGFALLRPGAVRAGTDCPAVGAIHPDQLTRFLAGYVTDQAMTYEEAMTFFESLTAEAVWDGGTSADLIRHEILPFRLDDWLQYVCTFTAKLILANQPDWVNSGITVSAGQSFTVEASGLMNPCSDTYPNGPDFCIFYAPEGAEGVVPYENEFGIFPGPGLRFMALLGRIGDGEPFYVGAGGTFTAEQDGTLWFTPNDNLRTDNQGAYSVLVWLEP